MPELNDRTLGTSSEHKVHYALHQTGSRLVGDLFLASYLAECIQMVDGLGPIHKLMLAKEGSSRGVSEERIKGILSQADDQLRWAAEMKAEDYHRTNVLAFLSFWAAQEAGNENVVSAILGTVRLAASFAAEKFALGKYDLGTWPWPEDMCLEIAQKLDQKAKTKTSDGGWDAAARLTTLFGWLGVELTIPSTVAEKYNEASMVRNVLLHRYGRLEPRDVARAPHLSQFENKAVQLTRDRTREYYQSVSDVHVVIMNGVTATGWFS